MGGDRVDAWCPCIIQFSLENLLRSKLIVIYYMDIYNICNIYMRKCQSVSELALKPDLWQWHHLFERIFRTVKWDFKNAIFSWVDYFSPPPFWMWLKLLDKKLHTEISVIWGWNPVDSRSFCPASAPAWTETAVQKPEVARERQFSSIRRSLILTEDRRH